MAALTDIRFDTSIIARTRTAIRTHLARRAEYNRVYNELARMSQRDLDDIGVARGNIDAIAREAAAGY
ncbi:protein of unknown function [Palleronia marisminoris]|uniref:YjiS-like domain-containing protein n=1 Tax=Palleronia marisminoris TaxID=315423 RepID=A0A1Y5SLV0_9RHOB|nr:DUF1127 domain-containing protein [Palleronia marisminoris]SFG88129.1 protein of unknown function [Palleronia marisminoris]SLN43403.1 hypothetical protein PAM7066_01903 [Palleronia marisminoris]